MSFRRNCEFAVTAADDQAAVCGPIVYCEIKRGVENVPV